MCCPCISNKLISLRIVGKMPTVLCSVEIELFSAEQYTCTLRETMRFTNQLDFNTGINFVFCKFELNCKYNTLTHAWRYYA